MACVSCASKPQFAQSTSRRGQQRQKCLSGSTETWTRIAGFRVLSANHYTIEPQTPQMEKYASYYPRCWVFEMTFFAVQYIDSAGAWTRSVCFPDHRANHHTIQPARLRELEMSHEIHLLLHLCNFTVFWKPRFYRDLNSDRRIQSPEC